MEYTLTCFKNFKCKANMCTDTCCIGWGIDIDKDTLLFYKNYKGDFSLKLEEGIDFNKGEIKMNSDKRCPFLNENNLCDIILNLGKEHISYICKNHPRFFNEFDTHKETGYGLCCEEALSLLLLNEVNLPDIKCDSPLFYLREKLFLIIKRKDLNLNEKFYYFLDIICGAEDCILFGDDLIDFLDSYNFEKKKIDKINAKKFLEKFKDLEPINSLWTKNFDIVYKNYKDNEDFYSIKNSEKYEKLFLYYTFRYLLKDIDEEDFLAKGKFVILMVTLNIIFDFILGIDNKNTILLSKQLEYSEDNLNFLLKLCDEDEDFSFDKIISYV